MQLTVPDFINIPMINIYHNGKLDTYHKLKVLYEDAPLADNPYK